jgi:hypothetical protein
VTTERCADCGKTIEFNTRMKQWGVRRGKSWHFCCRVVYDPETMTPSGVGSRILSADYHHVADQPQRHFPKERANG